MRILLALLLCVSVFSVFGQHGTIKVEKHDDFIPRIAGRAGGDISRYYLCDSKGITIGMDSRVVSFELYFVDEEGAATEIKINGNALADEHCKLLMSLPEENIVYFQNIMVESKGAVVKVTPMMFFLKEEDED